MLPSNAEDAEALEGTDKKELRFPLEQADILKSKIVFEPYKVIGSSFKFGTTRGEASLPQFRNALKKSTAGATPIQITKLDEKTELFLPLQFYLQISPIWSKTQ